MSHPSFQRWSLPALFVLCGMAVAFIRSSSESNGVAPETLPYLIAWQYAILAALGGGALILIFSRAKSRIGWEAVLTPALFLGVWFWFLLVLPLQIALLLAASLTVVALVFRRVILHDIFLLLGAMGVAINLASWLPGGMLLMVLAAFTVYDTVAGAPDGPIVELAKSLIARQIVPGVILPARPQDLSLAVSSALKTPAVFLGAGDVVLPLTLVSPFFLCGPL